MKKITVNPYDPDSVQNAIKELRDDAEIISDAADRVVEKATQKCAEEMIANIPWDIAARNQNYDPEIYTEYADGKGMIITDGSTPYLEFGTGVVGQQSGYPDGEYLANAGWEYASGPFVFTTKSGKTGWFWQNVVGDWYFTEGMPGSHFMHDAVENIAREIPEMLKEELANA